MMVFVEIGWIILAGIIFVAMIGGLALNIALWITENIVTILILSIVLSFLILIGSFFASGKKLIPAVASIVYSSQLCVMAVYGLYQIAQINSLMMVLIFLVWAFYVFLNLLAGFRVILFIWDDFCDSKGDGWVPAFFIGGLGLIGWVINYIFLF